MIEFSTLLSQGGVAPWLFIPTAILLGALHGLEPGHSKTMMAAFIVAIRGTVWQAALLGFAATLSHTAVVWAVAMGGLYLGSQWNAETSEPYFQVVSAILIISVAVWMLLRIRNEQTDSGHDHHHDEETHDIDIGHGVIVQLSIHEDGAPPRFRLTSNRNEEQTSIFGQNCHIETIRQDGTRQVFALAHKGTYLESNDEIPEPHAFTARLTIMHGDHGNDYDVTYTEHNHHGDHTIDLGQTGYQDAHELAHANDIKRRFDGRTVTTGQIIVFGLTGGLVPCPAAITILFLCLQLKKVTLGAALVLSFSIGLALTLVMSGVLAALSVRYASKHWSGFSTFARRAPYFSGVLIMIVGLYVGYHGLQSILHNI